MLADHRKLRRAPELLMSQRMQTIYPQLMCNLVEGMFTVTNPEPKKGVLALGWREAAPGQGAAPPPGPGPAGPRCRTFG